MEVTPRLTAVVDRLGALANELGARSDRITDLNTSPRMHAVMLFRRLRINLRGYMLMWQDGSFLNADILLRCIVEATICLAANAALGDVFVKLLRTDAASTLRSAIKLWREEGFSDLVAGGERHLREVFVEEREGGRGTLNWKDLADRAGQPRLYSFHRMLSGTSAHITGLSLLRGIVGVEAGDEEERAARGLDHAGGTVNFASMAQVVAIACRLQAGTVDASDLLPELDKIDTELRAIASEAVD